MKSVLFLLILCVSPVLAQWKEWGVFYGPTDYVPRYNGQDPFPGEVMLSAVLIDDSTPTDKWIRVNLLKSPTNPHGVPAWATGVLMGGIMIITPGRTSAIYDLTCAVRRAGSTFEAPYNAQAETISCGARTTGYYVCATDPGVEAIEFKWKVGPMPRLPPWPVGPSYRINWPVMGFYGPPGSTP